MNTNKCLIISGGDLTAKENIRMISPDLVIACDRGYRHAEKLGIRPDLIVGDFDSAKKEDAAAKLGVMTYPVEKDDTDTMLAIKEALGRGFREIEVTCFGGGRLDHLFANLQAGAYIAAAGARATLTSDDAAVFVEQAPCRMVLPCEEGRSLSVFSLSGECTGVTIRGAKYEAENVRITSTFPIGVSNEWCTGTAEISAETGILMVMTCRKESESR